MTTFTGALRSSLGKKYLMGFTGLVWVGFAIGHLIGNLLLLAGREAFNGYALFLETLGHGAAIYRLRVRPRSGKPIEVAKAREVLLPGLKLVLSGIADNDRLNELMLSANLDYRAANRLLFEVIEYVEPRMKADQAYPPVVGVSVMRVRHQLDNAAAEQRIMAEM